MEELLLKLVTVGLLAVIGWIDGRTMEIPYALSGALAICALADFFLFPGLPVGERLMGTWSVCRFLCIHYAWS